MCGVKTLLRCHDGRWIDRRKERVELVVGKVQRRLWARFCSARLFLARLLEGRLRRIYSLLGSCDVRPDRLVSPALV